MPFFAKAFAAWLVLLAAMTANGLFRALVLQPRLAEGPARRLSSLLGAAIVVALAGIFVRRLPNPSTSPLIWTGLFWGLLTVAFEFGFGHYASGLTWAQMLADYDVTEGRLGPPHRACPVNGVRTGSSPAAS